MPVSDALRRRLLSNEFAVRLREAGVIDEDQWRDLTSDLDTLAPEWRGQDLIERDLVSVIVTTILMLGGARETAVRHQAPDLAAEIGRSLVALYPKLEACGI